jgi:endonuclease III related protein
VEATMSRSADLIRRMYDAMFTCFGPQHWWPAEMRTEMVVGAMLTQNTAWKNVERALSNLRSHGLLDLKALHATPIENLAQLIRPAGYFNVKARRLRNLVDFICRNYDGDLDAFLDQPIHALREELLSVSGVGRETADSIILYAAEKPTFVVDAYTARILRRHFLIDETADYELIKDLFESALPADVQLYNEYHALLVACGKGYCRPRALCDNCPLNVFDHDQTVR